MAPQVPTRGDQRAAPTVWDTPVIRGLNTCSTGKNPETAGHRGRGCRPARGTGWPVGVGSGGPSGREQERGQSEKPPACEPRGEPPPRGKDLGLCSAGQVHSGPGTAPCEVGSGGRAGALFPGMDTRPQALPGSLPTATVADLQMLTVQKPGAFRAPP